MVTIQHYVNTWRSRSERKLHVGEALKEVSTIQTEKDEVQQEMEVLRSEKESLTGEPTALRGENEMLCLELDQTTLYM